MSPEQLDQWREKHKLTQEVAAEIFDISVRMLRYYLSGERQIPARVVAIALAQDRAVADQGGSQVGFWR